MDRALARECNRILIQTSCCVDVDDDVDDVVVVVDVDVDVVVGQ